MNFKKDFLALINFYSTSPSEVIEYNKLNPDIDIVMLTPVLTPSLDEDYTITILTKTFWDILKKDSQFEQKFIKFAETKHPKFLAGISKLNNYRRISVELLDKHIFTYKADRYRPWSESLIINYILCL